MYPEHEDYNTLYTPEQRKRFHDMQMRANGATMAAHGRRSLIAPVPAGPGKFLRNQGYHYPVPGNALEDFSLRHPELMRPFSFENCKAISRGFQHAMHPITGVPEKRLLPEAERLAIFNAYKKQQQFVHQVSEDWKDYMGPERDDAGANAGAIASLRAGHIDELHKLELSEHRAESGFTKKFIKTTMKSVGMFEMSTRINDNIIQHPCDIWSILKKLQALPKDDLARLVSLRTEYQKRNGQEKEEYMRRTGAVMLTLHLLKTGKIKKERQQIKDAIDFFCRHKKGTGNISSHFYVKALFDSNADPDIVALWNDATSLMLN